MARLIGGIVAGILAGFVVVGVVEMLGMRLFPAPEGMDPMNPESLRQYMGQMSAGSFIAVLVAWIGGGFVAPWVTGRIARHRSILPAVAVGGLFFGACAYNLVSLPHPLWFTAAAIVAVPLAAFAGARAGHTPVSGPMSGTASAG